jgi:hypothetical protein
MGLKLNPLTGNLESTSANFGSQEVTAGNITSTGTLAVSTTANPHLKLVDTTGDPDSFATITYNNGNDATDSLIFNVDAGNSTTGHQPGSHMRFYVDGNEKTRVDSNGLDVTGSLNITSGNFVCTGSLNTANELNFTGNSAKFIDFETLSGSHRFEFRHHDPTAGTFETAMKATANGGIDLFYDTGTYSTPKLSTTATGVTVNGSVTTQDMNMSNLNSSPNEVDNTNGSWSIQEGADDLFLINRVNGKKYKFNLTEIS